MTERDISLRGPAKSIPADVGYLSKISRDLERPSKDMAARIDNALNADGKLAALAQPGNRNVPGAPSPNVMGFAGWIESTNTGPSTIAFFERETRRVAVDYANRAPMEVMTDASALLEDVTRLMRDGRQRLAQTRALFQVSSQLLAVLCLLAGDVGRYGSARAYGHTAWLCAEEADSDLHRALVLSAQSKTAKWEQRYGEAATLARRGYEYSPPIEARILLASQEANALQAIRLGLAAHDPAWVLREVQAADDAWSEGDPWVYGTWSQVRIGAGIAHAMAGEVGGTAEEVAPVLELPPELRVVTIAGRLGVVERQLAQRRYAGSGAATDLREQIHDFRAGALHRQTIAPPEDR